MGAIITSPHTQTAIVGNAHGDLELSHSAPIPQAKDDIVLVCTAAISVNPVDAKMRGAYVTPGAIAGCDFAGTVEAIGTSAESQAAASERDIKVGDRVAAAIMGMNPLEPTLGAFAQHVGVRLDALIKLPDDLSFESACALGTSFMTAGLALFGPHSLALPGTPLSPLPLSPAPSPPIHVLVYGASTATGTAAIQLLLLAGYTPIATCSPHNFPLVTSYGVSPSSIHDYRLPTSAGLVRAAAHNQLRYALDCISSAASMGFCYAALGRAGGRYVALDPFPAAVALTRQRAVKPSWVLGPVMLGRDIGWPAPHGRKADGELHAWGVWWRGQVQELLARGMLRGHPLRVERGGGLGGVLEGVAALRAGEVSGVKLVYLLSREGEGEREREREEKTGENGKVL